MLLNTRKKVIKYKLTKKIMKLADKDFKRILKISLVILKKP